MPSFRRGTSARGPSASRRREVADDPFADPSEDASGLAALDRARVPARERAALQSLAALDKRAALASLAVVHDAAFMAQWGRFVTDRHILRSNVSHLHSARQVTAVADAVRSTLVGVSRSAQHLALLVKRLMQATRQVQRFVRARLRDLQRRKAAIAAAWKDAEADARQRIRGAIDALRERGRGNVTSQRFTDALWALYMDCWGHPETIRLAVERLWAETRANYLTRFRSWRSAEIRQRRAAKPGEAATARRNAEAKIGRAFEPLRFSLASVDLDDLAFHIALVQMRRPPPVPRHHSRFPLDPVPGDGDEAATGDKALDSSTLAASELRADASAIRRRPMSAPYDATRRRRSSAAFSVLSTNSGAAREERDAANGAAGTPAGRPAPLSPTAIVQFVETGERDPAHVAATPRAARAPATAEELMSASRRALAALPDEALVPRERPVSYYHALVRFDPERPHFAIFLKRLGSGEPISYAESAARHVQQQLMQARAAFLRWEGARPSKAEVEKAERTAHRNRIGPDGTPLSRYMPPATNNAVASPFGGASMRRSPAARREASPPPSAAKARSPGRSPGRSPQRSPRRLELDTDSDALSTASDDTAAPARTPRQRQKSLSPRRSNSRGSPPRRVGESDISGARAASQKPPEAPARPVRRTASPPRFVPASRSAVEIDAIRREEAEREALWARERGKLLTANQELRKRRRVIAEETAQRQAKAATARTWRRAMGENGPVAVSRPGRSAHRAAPAQVVMLPAPLLAAAAGARAAEVMAPHPPPSAAAGDAYAQHRDHRSPRGCNATAAPRRPPRPQETRGPLPVKQRGGPAADEAAVRALLSGRGGRYVRDQLLQERVQQASSTPVDVRPLAPNDAARWTSLQ